MERDVLRFSFPVRLYSTLIGPGTSGSSSLVLAIARVKGLRDALVLEPYLSRIHD
jgi:hypothetical protein